MSLFRTCVKDAPLQRSKIYVINVGERIMMAEIPKKMKELRQTLDLEQELFPKKVEG
ncbi:MAG: hypothetical protein QXO75_04945 [Nitrososphaerota archaeon]